MIPENITTKYASQFPRPRGCDVEFTDGSSATIRPDLIVSDSQLRQHIHDHYSVEAWEILTELAALDLTDIALLNVRNRNVFKADSLRKLVADTKELKAMAKRDIESLA